MGLEYWDSEAIRQYARAIKTSEKIEKERAKRREKWLNNFINGKPVKQFEEYIENVDIKIRKNRSKKCPCEKLTISQRKVLEAEEQVKLMHEAANKILAEYGRLHQEEEGLKEIFAILEQQVDESSKYQRIIKVCDKIQDFLKKLKDKQKK